MAEEFVKSDDAAKWLDLFNTLFYGHLSDPKPRGRLELIPREGVDPEKVWRMVRCALGTFGCKHEHKRDGVAYMLNFFFKDYRWVDA